MKFLGSPAGLAVAALLLAVAVHPAFIDARDSMNGPLVVAVVAALFALAALLRAFAARTPGAVLLAAGAAIALGALATNAVRGHEGTLRLLQGQAAQAFEERGPAGIRLGARPLKAMITLEDLGDGQASLTVDEKGVKRRETLALDQSVRVGAFRLGWGRLIPHARLAVSVAQGATTETVEVSETQPAVTGDLQIEIDTYFPDFALDANNKPYSRSDEPKNPAALLRVYRGEKGFRVFVLQSMPGVHDVSDLGARLALRRVANDPELEITVNAEPAAPWLGVGMALFAVGLAWGARR